MVFVVSALADAFMPSSTVTLSPVFTPSSAGGGKCSFIDPSGVLETAILHGAIVWLLALPLLLAFAAFGLAGQFGGWYGGLSGVPAWAAAVPPADPEIAKMMRNTAVASVAALLIGLMGSVIGGWMASGEPMTFTYYRSREIVTRRVPAKSLSPHRRERHSWHSFLAALLGAPLTLILILFLIGVGR